MPGPLNERERSTAGAPGRGGLPGPEGPIPPLAPGETLVKFTDFPENWTTDRGPEKRRYDIRKIDGKPTPAEEFFTTQHHGHPKINGERFRLQLTGLLDRPEELSLETLHALGEIELEAGFECSGNSASGMQGSASNAIWTGVPLRKILNHVGVRKEAKEIVFFGADRAMMEVEFRRRQYTVNQHYGRSATIHHALAEGPLVATALNGAPLTVHQGFPARLIMPGWYGAPNVKWLNHIHAQEAPYLGHYQARWYRTLRSETIGGEARWVESAITRMRLKSVIARLSRMGDDVKIVGFVLNDGTPLASVEIKIDDGPWMRANLQRGPNTYAWKLFSYEWKGVSPGEHTIVSRATDAHGNVQPTREELSAVKKTRLEDNSQHPRTVWVG